MDLTWIKAQGIVIFGMCCTFVWFIYRRIENATTRVNSQAQMKLDIASNKCRIDELVRMVHDNQVANSQERDKVEARMKAELKDFKDEIRTKH